MILLNSSSKEGGFARKDELNLGRGGEILIEHLTFSI